MPAKKPAEDTPNRVNVDAEAEPKPYDGPVKRIVLDIPNSEAKAFTSQGACCSGSVLDLPEPEAKRFMDLGLAHLSEREPKVVTPEEARKAAQERRRREAAREARAKARAEASEAEE